MGNEWDVLFFMWAGFFFGVLVSFLLGLVVYGIFKSHQAERERCEQEAFEMRMRLKAAAWDQSRGEAAGLQADEE